MKYMLLDYVNVTFNVTQLSLEFRSYNKQSNPEIATFA